MSVPAQVYTVYIRTQPEQLWQAITDGEWTMKYFQARVTSAWEPGASMEYVNPDGFVGIRGEVLEAERPSRLAVTWRFEYSPEFAAEPFSRVTWEIEPISDSVCRLTVTHDDFPSENATYREVQGGWSMILSNLKTVVETGEPLAYPPRG